MLGPNADLALGSHGWIVVTQPVVDTLWSLGVMHVVIDDKAANIPLLVVHHREEAGLVIPPPKEA